MKTPCHSSLLSRWFALSMVAAAGSFNLGTSLHSEEATPKRPNILLILADDMGFSDAGCYGGDIHTPHLDELAAQGLRYTQAYNTSRCWPSRACILTGYYAQQVRRDTVPGIPSGGKGIRPGWARLLPEYLRDLGYRTYHSGKWHVDGDPMKNGFDHSYDLEDHDRNFGPKRLLEDGKKLPPVDPTSGYYTTTAFADHAIKCLKEHASKYADRPFFEYLAFTVPHFPLMAPPQDIAKYTNTYRRGWDIMREERWQRLSQMGIVHCALSAVERDLGPPYFFANVLPALGPGEVNRPIPWDQLTGLQQAFQATKMSIHAAMVDRMDFEIGRVLDQIRAMGEWEDTLVLFLSDNGASAEMMVRGDGHDPNAPMGSAASYLCLGPGWSSNANSPFRRHKTWVHEGGISTPLIVEWPRGIKAHGELRNAPVHIIDLLPTLVEAAGGKLPDTWNGAPVPARPGKSLVSTFGKDQGIARDYLWWCHEVNRAYRVGNWKIVAAGKESPWELYDLGQDRCEMKDLAKVYPDKVKQMGVAWESHFDEFCTLARKDVPKGAAPAAKD